MEKWRNREISLNIREIFFKKLRNSSYREYDFDRLTNLSNMQKAGIFRDWISFCYFKRLLKTCCMLQRGVLMRSGGLTLGIARRLGFKVN